MDDRPIGIFDSGVGGLTVFNAVVDLLPNESIVYLGDTARVPYGNRSAKTVQRYATNATRLLKREDIKALVIACNTASAYAFELLSKDSTIPVIGVINPVAHRACSQTRSGHVGVIGTRGTVRSGAYERAIDNVDPNVKVTAQPCPLFVPLAEEGWVDGDVPTAIAKSYFSTFEGSDLDTLILGCTHYPILKSVVAQTIEDLLQREISVLDCATATAEALKDELGNQSLASGKDASYTFWATDDPIRFAESAESFTTLDRANVEHVEITDV